MKIKRLIIAVVSTVFLLSGLFSLAAVQINQTEAPTTWTLAQYTSSPSVLSNNNYYTDSAGDLVHSPAYSLDGSVPAGATAECVDGYYSFSQTASGTCSDHDGVYQWLTPASSTDSTVPAGATAECEDGTYSISQTASGTCSDHGGVYQWLY
jgi:hypothetical protein